MMRLGRALAGLAIGGTVVVGLGAPSFGHDTAPSVKAGSEVRLYVDPQSPARSQATAWRGLRPEDARMMDQLATQPVAEWFGSETKDIHGEVKSVVAAAAATRSVPVLVAYNIPDRDCGGYSAGGAGSDSRYLEWIKLFANAIGRERAILILEPDALLETECLSEAALQRRLRLLAEAVGIFTKNAGTRVYIDAGNPGWQAADRIAARLRQAGIERAVGFALNVSNFASIEENVAYGNEIAKLLGGKHFVIDTSRNGLGSNGEWCNPPGRAIGKAPTFSTDHELVDAYLWIKVPGESDGECNGGPAAGEWWPDYALQLVRNASRTNGRK